MFHWFAMSVLVFVVIFFQGTIQVVGEVVDEVFKGFSWVEKVFLLRVAFGFDVCLGFGRYSYQVPCQKEVFLDDFGWVPSWNECVPTISIKWLRKPNLILIYGKKKRQRKKTKKPPRSHEFFFWSTTGRPKITGSGRRTGNPTKKN